MEDDIMITKCPLCDLEIDALELPNRISGKNKEVKILDCENCGKFEFEVSAYYKLVDISNKKLSLIKHKIAKANFDGNSFCFTSDILANELTDCEFLTATQIVNNVIQLIGQKTRPGGILKVFPMEVTQIVGADNPKYLQNLLKHMTEAKLIQFKSSINGSIQHEIIASDIELTLKGWERFDLIKLNS